MAVSTIDPNGLNVGQLGGTRNVVINGEMMIDQRNGGSSTTPTANDTYTLDRWAAELAISSKYSVQQSSDAPSGFKNSMLITSLSSYSLTANDFYMMQYRVEGFDAARFNWGSSNAKNATLSFWVKSSLTGTFGGAFENSANNRAYAFSYTINSANTWEYKTITVSGDQTGTWLTTNGIGIRLRFALGVGSTYSGTGGVWGSTRYFSVTGATSVVSTSGATWQLAGVQLEVGDTATDFEYESYGTTLQKCKRYYQKFGNLGGYDVVAFAGIAPYTTQVQAATPLSPEMRVTPSLSLANIAAADTVNPQVAVTSAAVNSGTHNNKIAWVAYYTSGSLTAFRPYYLRVDGTSTGYIAFDAEL